MSLKTCKNLAKSNMTRRRPSPARTKALQAIATETADYSKKSLESGSAFVEQLLGAKSYDNAIQIQTEYWKTSYAGFIAQATRMGELYSGLAKETFKPIEGAFAKVYDGKI
jgi:hypothetical protein